MDASSHNGEPGSALDAELRWNDIRHREGYAAGFKAGREAGMREASGIVQPSYNQCRDEREIAHALQMKADAILSAIGGGK